MGRHHHQLVARLGDLAGSHGPTVDDSLAQAGEDGSGPFEVLHGASDHDGKLARFGAPDAPAHWSVKEAHAIGREVGREGACIGRQKRRGVNEEPPGTVAADDPAVAQCSLPNGLHIGHGGDDDLHPGGHAGGIGSRLRHRPQPRLRQRLDATSQATTPQPARSSVRTSHRPSGRGRSRRPCPAAASRRDPPPARSGLERSRFQGSAEQGEANGSAVPLRIGRWL